MTNLNNLKQQAINAHSFTSFSPERRGEQILNEFNEELNADIEELQKGGASEESIANYTARYEKYFSSWLGAKGRCISSMITGGSNFPVRRAEKANRSEHNHYVIFKEWRIKAKKAIIRNAQPAKTFTSELERYQIELAKCIRTQQLMKGSNAIIRKAKGQDCTIELVAIGLSELSARKIQLPDFMKRIGFATYQLSNNNANIKRLEGRIKEMELKQFNSNVIGAEEFLFEGGKVVVNHELDRVQIKHDTKPAYEVIQSMKKNGFKWSPTNTAWQRQITNEAFYKVNLITGVKIA